MLMGIYRVAGSTRLQNLAVKNHVAEGIEGAVTGVEGVWVMRMLYADDLSFTSNKADQMQCMLDRLLPYVRKGLTVKSCELADNGPFRYLGMLFVHNSSMAAAAERVVPTFHAGCMRVMQFVCQYELVDRPQTLLWLTKTYIIPASVYGSQIWGTSYPGHMLGNKRSTCNWSAVICFFKSMLTPNSKLVRKILKADRALSAPPGVKCWRLRFWSLSTVWRSMSSIPRLC
eukprot:1151020-Pelagomonas_calceolata.AAC.1